MKIKPDKKLIKAIESLLARLFPDGAPFAGKTPGPGWEALSAEDIERHIYDDHDARFKPLSFIPLARHTTDYGRSQNLFGLRLTPGEVIPSFWSRNGMSILNCNHFVSYGQLHKAAGIKGSTKGIKEFYRLKNENKVQAVEGFPLLFSEPNFDDSDLNLAQRVDLIARLGQAHLRKFIGNKKFEAKEWEDWLNAIFNDPVQKINHFDLNQYNCLENASYWASFRGSSGSYIVCPLWHADALLHIEATIVEKIPNEVLELVCFQAFLTMLRLTVNYLINYFNALHKEGIINKSADEIDHAESYYDSLGMLAKSISSDRLECLRQTINSPYLDKDLDALRRLNDR